MAVKNAQLKQNYKQFLEEALQICRDELAKGIALSPRLPWYLDMSNFNLLPIWRFVHGLTDRLSKLQSYKICIESLKANPLFSQYLDTLVANAYGGSRVESSMFLVSIVSEYLSIVPNALYSNQIFENLYSEREEYLYSDSVSFLSFTPLYNFAGDFECLELEPGLTIKKLTTEDREKLQVNPDDIHGSMLLASFDHAIVQEYEVKKIYDKHSSMETLVKRTSQITTLLTSLRLFGSGLFGTKNTITIPKEWTPANGTVRTGRIYEFSYLGPSFSLKSSELESFKRFYEQFKSFDTSGYETALRRFNYYYDRPELEDRILDSMIAFESLLLPESNELALRLSLRAANLLGHDDEEKNGIFTFFVKAYSVRSRIAHGSQTGNTIQLTNNEEVPLDEFVRKLEDYLRKTIVALLLEKRSGHSKDEIMRRLVNPFLTMPTQIVGEA